MLDVSILIQALPYIRQFRDKLFVIKLGGELLRDAAHLDAIASDLTLASMVGIKVIAVHGGGPQANELSETLGFKPELVGGRRVTDDKALEVAKMVFAGKINTELLSALSRHGARAIGVSGVDANIVRAKRRPLTKVLDDEGTEREVDFGHVGDVESVDPTLLEHLIKASYVPVVCSLAADEQGTILNVNADTIAAELAIALGAEKLINMTSVPGVYADFATKAEVISVLTAARAEALIEENVAGKGMRPKLTNCIRAVRGGVHQAHIINGLTRHSLLVEIFTDRGIGTMVIDQDPQAA
ncbi:MAG: acetylglutamate kinase [Planctomycetota bacterium]|jgi:acetylglutamate kinase